jgi:hypothetical protein
LVILMSITVQCCTLKIQRVVTDIYRATFRNQWNKSVVVTACHIRSVRSTMCLDRDTTLVRRVNLAK